jgi:hypothetical protein
MDTAKSPPAPIPSGNRTSFFHIYPGHDDVGESGRSKDGIPPNAQYLQCNLPFRRIAFPHTAEFSGAPQREDHDSNFQTSGSRLFSL